MNSSTYIFGELSNGYSQYPEDSSSNLFKYIQDQCVATSQLIIHRDDNMMYYIYVRKLGSRKYIGFAIAINGYYFTQIQPLFSLFEQEIEHLVETGIIINLTNNGDVTSRLASLSDEEEEVMSVINGLQQKINRLRNIKKLPPVDFSVDIASRKIFKDSDSLNEITNASCRFGFTIILKESDYDTIRTTSFKNVLKDLNAENVALNKEIEELKQKNKKIQQQKKQFKNVILLILIVIACTIGIYSLTKNLNATQSNLDSANSTITEKESIISNKNSTIYHIRDSIRNLESELKNEIEAKHNIENSLSSICSYTPFAVTGCSIDYGYFKFNYYAPTNKTVTVTLKALSERDDEIISNTHSVSLSQGSGSKTLFFDYNLNYSKYYYVVLIYDGHIVAGKRW